MAKITEEPERKCPQCNKVIDGRPNKKFCDEYCRTTFNYNRTKNHPSLFTKIHEKLMRNRKLLDYFNKGGTVTVRKELLVDKGFDPHYFTHYWKNTKGDIYLFCYEHGFLKKNINGKEKYILILWQDYMKASEGIV